MFGWITDLFNATRVVVNTSLRVLCSEWAQLAYTVAAIPALLAIVETFVVSRYIPSIGDVSFSAFQSLFGSNSIIEPFLWCLRLDLWASLLDCVIAFLVFVIAFIPNCMLGFFVFTKLATVRSAFANSHRI